MPEMICDDCHLPTKQLCNCFKDGDKILFKKEKNGICFHCRLRRGIGFDFELEEFARRQKSKRQKPRFGKQEEISP